MKNKTIILLILLSLFAIPPIIRLIILISSFFGFITLDRQDAWISFYGSIIGGGLTLLGVGWTISYTISTRKEDQVKHEKERKEEFDRRNLEIKYNLSARYKPILSVYFHPDFIIEGIKYGLSKYKNIHIQNEVLLSNHIEYMENDKRLFIILSLQNIGRGEANDLIIKSFIQGPDDQIWNTISRQYKEIYVSNGINIIYIKSLSDDEWNLFENNYLIKPLKIIINIVYSDLTRKQYQLQSRVYIKRFIHNRDEKGRIIENVLVLNPYDTLIENEIN